jgi:serine/threonine-protein kinase
MGAVYRALDQQVGEIVAFKILTPGDDGGTDPIELRDAVERFRQEVRLARRVTHRNVVRLYDYGEVQGMHFLTMELLEGETLRELLERERPLAPARAAAIGVQVADGLAAIHATGVVHRDLKPSNVLVEPDGRVAVTDFGVARTLGGTSAFHTEGRAGTPAYMAPEQLTGDHIDFRTDLYALGLVLYVMLTGKLPFGSGAPADLWARVDSDAPDPRALELVPDALAAQVQRCLRRDPAERPESAGAVADVLRAFAAAAAMEPSDSTASGRPREAATIPHATFVDPAPPSGLRASLEPGTRAVAVLPFVHRGAAEDDFLAEGLADVLVDVLATTRGLRVIASGATVRYRNERDPALIARDLEVNAIVDGTVTRRGDEVRVAARLVAAPEGFQLWSGRFEGRIEDVFAFQDQLGRRIAEALRVELTALEHRGAAPAEVVEWYMRGRQKYRAGVFGGPDGAVAHYERCLAMAPDFAPAIASLAQASLMAWFFTPHALASGFREICRGRVAHALEAADDVAESHIAAAMFAAQDGDLAETGGHIGRALSIAPTCADAHLFLGRLQCEAGRSAEGTRRVRLARELDPTLLEGLSDLALDAALNGRLDEAMALFDEARMSGAEVMLAFQVQRMRVASWYGKLDVVREGLEAMHDSRTPMIEYTENWAELIVGKRDAARAEDVFTRLHGANISPRLSALSQQLATEALALRGETDRAIAHLTAAASVALVDLRWMDRCPPIAALRTRPEFLEARKLVARRARHIQILE